MNYSSGLTLKKVRDSNGRNYPWTRHAFDILEAGNELSVSDLAEQMYGEANYVTVRVAQGTICGIRSRLENKTGLMLVCNRGTYSLVRDAKEIELDSAKRTNGADAKLKSAYRSYVSILNHFPELTPKVLIELSKLTKRAAVAMDIYAQAQNVFPNTNKQQLKENN